MLVTTSSSQDDPRPVTQLPSLVIEAGLLFHPATHGSAVSRFSLAGLIFAIENGWLDPSIQERSSDPEAFDFPSKEFVDAPAAYSSPDSPEFIN